MRRLVISNHDRLGNQNFLPFSEPARVLVRLDHVA
jgi:hypothetical protein